MTDPGTILRLDLHSAVLADMAGSRPKRLLRAMLYQAEDLPPGAGSYANEEDFRQVLLSAAAGDQLVEMWRKQLTQWDRVVDPIWSTTEPRTDDRRADVYRLLELEPATAKLLEAAIPVVKSTSPVVISDKFLPWYDATSRYGRPWYWPSYRGVLERKGWSPQAVADLDDATDKVVERLSDPSRPEAYQSKGLVVGYVQSGKTANFTGVIAKAVDAGYRLVIVLGGTLNMLRAQTQRRLDMELVGRENILRGASEYESDYADDPAWSKGKFVEFGGLPSALGGFDIVRMTTRDDDYKSLLQGIVALEFEKQEPALPLYDPRNLHRASARLMVVKKNKTVLGKLVRDLRKIKTPLSEIPVLIIDDESDEASVNTSRRNKADAERTAINQKIADLLTMLPRAQYIGYTATPYANVFIDPSDTADIFPKDFIISLPAADGYMGARDFHDLDSDVLEEERDYTNSNEKAHVRDVKVSGDDDTDCLRQAIDMFVLTAAMKLYREEHGRPAGYYEHHTMLIHESSWLTDHRALLGLVSQLWWNSAYSGAEGHQRLRRLFDEDVFAVSTARAAGDATPASYDELMPYVGPATVRIGGDQKPIIVVNGDKDLETGEADFDKRSIWKILIGGQKLSRGFTVEGLTVTYFRRRATNMSALMQMGRWFGFREGYRDLVRLYIGREEAGANNKDIDLYKAFEAICLDEENFRNELAQYAVMVDGEPQVTPAEVPPLVSQHLPWLKPTSANKMYNCRLVEIQSAGRWEEPTAYPTAVPDLRRNTALWLPILNAMPEQLHTLSYVPPGGKKPLTFKALAGVRSADEVLGLLEALEWRAPSQFTPHLEYLRQITRTDRQLVEDWLILAPQHNRAASKASFEPNGREYSWFGRERRRDPLFGAISDPKHRAAALRIAGALADSGDPVTESLVRPKRGVLVVYPIVEPAHRQQALSTGQLDAGKVVMAFGFVAPSSARYGGDRVVRFVTIDSSQHAAIIDA
ncbi:Z1 domain-containing protein [Nocardia farcinica]|uniref:Z1 domain-containing protein n=1 Tax=Nocardia farcinica TaxID=37329 RepID=UPI000A39CAF6|nr:Z1 domain-containing protein [Nocardia farcinica]MBF6250886.1 Z1 domain-containing protein [Nocardia farcinica]